MVEKLEAVPNFLPKTNPYTALLDPRNLFFEVDNVGLIAALSMPDFPKLFHVHITFWDGRLRGREELCRTVGTWITLLTDRMLFTQIPIDRKALLAFALRVGFVPSADTGSVRTLVFPNYTE